MVPPPFNLEILCLHSTSLTICHALFCLAHTLEILLQPLSQSLSFPTQILLQDVRSRMKMHVLVSFQRFTNEDHLAVHKLKHEMTLKFGPSRTDSVIIAGMCHVPDQFKGKCLVEPIVRLITGAECTQVLLVPPVLQTSGNQGKEKRSATKQISSFLCITEVSDVVP